MKTLANLVDEQNALDSLMVELAGDISDQQIEETVIGWINEIKSGLADKVDSYEFKQQALKQQEEKFKQRAEMFYAAAKACGNLSKNLKDRMKYAMIEMDKVELTGNLYRYKLSQSKPSVVIEDESKLPMEYVNEVVTYKADKEKIKADLESGKNISGASLERSFSIRTYVAK